MLTIKNCKDQRELEISVHLNSANVFRRQQSNSSQIAVERPKLQNMNFTGFRACHWEFEQSIKMMSLINLIAQATKIRNCPSGLHNSGPKSVFANSKHLTGFLCVILCLFQTNFVVQVEEPSNFCGRAVCMKKSTDHLVKLHHQHW